MHLAVWRLNLGALGAVARSTALLPAIHRKYPDATLTWVTDRPGDQILMGVPGIHRVLTTTTSDLLKLRALQFDVALVVDKSLEAEGVLAHLQVQPESVFGFRVNARTGAVMPATAAASELWSIGISNKTKFFENRKTENQLIHEALELGPFVNDEYQLCLTSTESKAAVDRRSQWVTEVLQVCRRAQHGMCQYHRRQEAFHRRACGLDQRIEKSGGRSDRPSRRARRYRSQCADREVGKRTWYRCDPVFDDRGDS